MLMKKLLVFPVLLAFCIQAVVAPKQQGKQDADNRAAIKKDKMPAEEEPTDAEIIENRERAKREAENAPVWLSNTFNKTPIYKAGKEPKPAPPVVESKSRCGRFC